MSKIDFFFLPHLVGPLPRVIQNELKAAFNREKSSGSQLLNPDCVLRLPLPPFLYQTTQVVAL